MSCPTLNLKFGHRPITFQIGPDYLQTIDFIKKAYLGDPNAKVKITVTNQYGAEAILKKDNFYNTVMGLKSNTWFINGKLEVKYSPEKQAIINTINQKMEPVLEEIKQIANQKLAEKLQIIKQKFDEINRLIKENQN